MGKIFLIMGPSSSGKDTIYKELKNLYPEFKEIILYTNRPIRENEKDGIDYNFVSLDKINEMEKNNEILEKRKYNTVHGLWVYATAKTNIDLANNNYIGINTLDGYESLKKYYKDDIIPLYIHVEDGIRLRRALDREDKQENPKYAEMCRRYLADINDFNVDRLLDLEIDKLYDNSKDMETCINEISNKKNKELNKDKNKKKN